MEEKVYNVNTATLDELNTLPGMSAELAQRIQAGRPYTEVEAVKHVKGVGGRLFKRWQPLLTVNGHVETESGVPVQLETALLEEVVQAGYGSLPLADEAEIIPPAQVVEPSPAAGVDEAAVRMPESAGEVKALPLPTPVVGPVTPSFAGAAQPVTKEPAARVYVTRTQAVLLAFLSSGLTLVLTTGVTLLVLFIINGGLQFASSPAFNRLDNQVAQLSSQANGLEQDLQAVQARLQVVDALSAQVSGMEEEVTGLKQDVQSAQASVKEIASNVEQISQDVDVLTAQVSVFDRFLDGLRSLLNGITPPSNP